MNAVDVTGPYAAVQYGLISVQNWHRFLQWCNCYCSTELCLLSTESFQL